MPRIDAEYLARELSRGVSFPEIAEVTGVSPRTGALLMELITSYQAERRR